MDEDMAVLAEEVAFAEFGEESLPRPLPHAAASPDELLVLRVRVVEVEAGCGACPTAPGAAPAKVVHRPPLEAGVALHAVEAVALPTPLIVAEGRGGEAPNRQVLLAGEAPGMSLRAGSSILQALTVGFHALGQCRIIPSRFAELLGVDGLPVARPTTLVGSLVVQVEVRIRQVLSTVWAGSHA